MRELSLPGPMADVADVPALLPTGLRQPSRARPRGSVSGDRQPQGVVGRTGPSRRRSRGSEGRGMDDPCRMHDPVQRR